VSAHRFVLGPDEVRERVDKALARLLPDLSRATIQRWIGEGRVLVSGVPCRARDAIGPGSVVDVTPGPRPETRAVPDASVSVSVVFEDEHLLVVDKPAGMVVHPARGHATGTLVNGLVARGSLGGKLLAGDGSTAALRPGIVHRIDKDTSGLLVVAKDEKAREGLKAQLQAHRVERKYLALTLGVPKSGVIESLFARHPRSRLRFTSRSKTGRRAVTHVALLEALAGGRAALVACRLETGRTHQIRVHLSEQCGTPLLADALYGRVSADPELGAIARALGRQALHAALLGFTHPWTAESLRFESGLPSDLETALAALRALAK
jgi:23S rRNA pseudouridine1911/1915/1917 synthase